MKVHVWISVAIVAAIATRARADHHHMAMAAEPADAADFTAAVALVAASFETMNYVGDYEGAVASATWTHDRVSVTATAPLYRLYENGAAFVGVGDVALAAHVALATADAAQLGVMAMVSAPTGNGDTGLGMGHAMAMPAVYGAWRWLAASVGYSRALADLPRDHDHGVWPLVDPMNMSELTWSASGEVPVRAVRFGARVSGGVPVGHLPGHTRVIGALRVAFGHGRVETAAELQGGLVGDPFTLRAVVETALRF